MTLITDTTVNGLVIKALEGRPEAIKFLSLFGAYASLVDDVLDEFKDIDRNKQLAVVSSAMYNCAYWKKWGHLLTIVEHLTINQYFDSVKWETADEQWKREHAKVYSHAGINMIFAVLLIELGHDKLSELSLVIRECAYNMHKDDTI